MNNNDIFGLIFFCVLLYGVGLFFTAVFWDERRRSFKWDSEGYNNGPFHPILLLVWPLLLLKGALKFIWKLLVEIAKEFLKPSSWSK